MLEALAIGIPTVCTDCPPGGASLYIKDGINGFSVTKDTGALAKLVNYLNDDEIIRIGKQARQSFLSDYSRFNMGINISRELHNGKITEYL